MREPGAVFQHYRVEKPVGEIISQQFGFVRPSDVLVPIRSGEVVAKGWQLEQVITRLLRRIRSVAGQRVDQRSSFWWKRVPYALPEERYEAQ